jgi:hypothetical protein
VLPPDILCEILHLDLDAVRALKKDLLDAFSHVPLGIRSQCCHNLLVMLPSPGPSDSNFQGPSQNRFVFRGQTPPGTSGVLVHLPGMLGACYGAGYRRLAQRPPYCGLSHGSRVTSADHSQLFEQLQIACQVLIVKNGTPPPEVGPLKETGPVIFAGKKALRQHAVAEDGHIVPLTALFHFAFITPVGQTVGQLNGFDTAHCL